MTNIINAHISNTLVLGDYNVVPFSTLPNECIHLPFPNVYQRAIRILLVFHCFSVPILLLIINIIHKHYTIHYITPYMFNI